MDQKIALLSKVPLLAGLSKAQLEQIARICDEVDLPAGKVITREGSSGAEFFVLISGSCSVERDGQVVRELGPGDFFGELSLLADIPRTATVRATSACRLIVVGHREFHSLLAEFPSIQTPILQATAKRLSETEADARH